MRMGQGDIGGCTLFRLSEFDYSKPLLIATDTTLQVWNKANDSQRQQPLAVHIRGSLDWIRNTREFDSDLHVNKIYM